MFTLFNNTKGDWPVLGLILLIYTFFWIIAPHMLILSDPWGYSELAYALSAGEFLNEDPGNIFVHRLGATLVPGLIYKLFGVSIYTTNLWPFATALLTLVTLWVALPDRASRIVAVALCATNPVFFEFSKNLYPDIIAAAFMTLSTLFLVRRENYLPSRLGWLYPVFAICCLFMAFLAKLSAYWVAPVWIVVFALDMKARRHDLFRHFYLPALLTGIALGALYLVYNAWAWGDPLIRFSNVSDVVEAGLWAINGPDADQVMLKRLTIEPVGFLLKTLGIVLVPALVAIPFIPRHLRIWAGYTFCCLFFFWFGTSSFSSYQPLPMYDRYILPVLPGLCILAGHFLANIRLPQLQDRPAWQLVPAGIVVAISVLLFNSYLSGWRDSLWVEQLAIGTVQSDLAENPDAQLLVITLESRSPDALKFFFGYDYPDNLQIISAETFSQGFDQAALTRFDRIYLYQNRSMAYFLNQSYGNPLFDLTPLEQRAQRLFDAAGITVDLLQN